MTDLVVFRHCCEINCLNEARYILWFGQGSDDYTESCPEHLTTLAETNDKELFALEVIDPGEGN